MFDLEGYPRATRAYAWSHLVGDAGERRRFFAVLHLGGIRSPLAARRGAGCYRGRAEGQMRWSLFVALAILPFEATARYVDDYGEGGGGYLLIFLLVCVGAGLWLGGATTLKDARGAAITLAVVLAIAAFLDGPNAAAILAGAAAHGLALPNLFDGLHRHQHGLAN